MYYFNGKSNRGHGICPLYRGCPFFRVSVIRGFTVNQLHYIVCSSMTRYFCYHELINRGFTWRILQLGVSDMPFVIMMHMLIEYCHGEVM